MAWRLVQQLPNAERLLPDRGKDWNEQLAGGKEPAPHRQQFSTLWKWYSAALIAGRSEKYLNRIREVSVSLANGESLSERAKAAMKQDLNKAKNEFSVCY